MLNASVLVRPEQGVVRQGVYKCRPFPLAYFLQAENIHTLSSCHGRQLLSPCCVVMDVVTEHGEPLVRRRTTPRSPVQLRQRGARRSQHQARLQGPAPPMRAPRSPP
ncbi:MAG: hypothetical protein ACI9EF_001178, partial [Pseudohongiellaceae bacterium]